MKIGNGKEKKKNKHTEFAIVTYVFVILFLIMIGYLLWFTAVRSEGFINNSYNSKRIDAFAKNTVRGDILDRKGEVLATTKQNSDGTEERVYPKGNRYAHVVGYTSNGKMGLEQTANYYLLKSHADPFLRLKNAFSEEKDPGDSLVTTLWDPVQQASFEALGDYRGAVITMNPETGEVLSCVSKPDFDPNEMEAEYEQLAEADNGVLLNRASQGRYAPGSTFKILTTLEFLREHPKEAGDYSFDCEGSYTADGKEIHCYHHTVHGEEDLLTSFSNSCNASYAKIGLSLSPESFQKTTETMFFDEPIICSLPTEKPRFLLEEGASDSELMETAIGQGKTYVTPLQMLLIVSAVENKGMAKKPVLCREIRNNRGKIVERFQGGDERQIMTAEEAALMEEFLRSVVENGTGRGLQSEAYTAYGKTGTAEINSEGDCHAWFVGYAKAEGKEPIAIAVILEGAGAGSTYAVPAAKQVFDAWVSAL